MSSPSNDATSTERKQSGSRGSRFLTRFQTARSQKDSINEASTAGPSPPTGSESGEPFSSHSAASSQVTLTNTFSPSPAASQVTLTSEEPHPRRSSRISRAQAQPNTAATTLTSAPYSIDTPTTSLRLSREVDTFNPRSAGGGNAWSDVGNTPSHTSSVDRADFVDIMRATQGMTSEEVRKYLKERNGGLQGADGEAIMKGAKGRGYLWLTGDFRGTM